MADQGAGLVVRDVTVRAVVVPLRRPGLPMSSHLYPEVSGHLLRVTPSGQWLEWQDWAHPVLARPFEVSSGELHLPDVPGNGLAWDDGAVAHYQADL